MKAPKCLQCGYNHWSSEPHKWPDTDTGHIRGVKEFKPKERVHKLVKKIVKSVHNPTKSVDVATKSVHNVKDVCTQIREVSIRQFRSNMATELKSLPFRIIKNGRVIAVVRDE